MKMRFYTPVYAITLLVSAALIFSVQPMFSKMLLPLLGGTPQVWNTAMLFFQVMLLAGYAYAHATTHFLGIRAQSVLHILLLILFMFVLPIGIPENWEPPTDRDPTFWQLSLMMLVVGGPFFILSGSAPMIQRWFSATDHPDAHNPYFLYGASNLGSMSALLAYPFLIEPFFALGGQATNWMYTYIFLTVLTVICAAMVWSDIKEDHKTGSVHTATPRTEWPIRFKWLLLAFLPSSLMLGVTTYITTDIASVPLLWVLPLALYVGTFIIVFSRRTYLQYKTIATLTGVFLVLMLVEQISFVSVHPIVGIFTHLSLFFFAALLCHTELAQSRPKSEKLTEFYLIMSIGGALGGFFNAIIAPQFLYLPIEYTAVLIAIMFLRYQNDNEKEFSVSLNRTLQSVKNSSLLDNILRTEVISLVIVTGSALFALYSGNSIVIGNVCAGVIAFFLLLNVNTRWLFAVSGMIVLIAFAPGLVNRVTIDHDTIHVSRNFFGILKVVDQEKERLLMHGTTTHGTQALLEDYRLTRLSYYGKTSPLNDVFDYHDLRESPQNMAVVGLGIGVVACYTKEGRHYDFYEIDKDVVDIAENEKYFTFLSDCGSPYDIILGDGRLQIAKQPEETYDLIVLDAFSSDNIPVHLITKEAVELYLSRLKEGGFLVFNVSNNYLDIEPVLAKIAESLNVQAYAHSRMGEDIGDTGLFSYPSHWVVLSSSNRVIDFLEDRGWSAANTRPGVNVWTDTFSNIVSVLDNKTGVMRVKKGEEKNDAAE